MLKNPKKSAHFPWLTPSGSQHLHAKYRPGHRKGTDALISGPGIPWDLLGDRDRMGVLGYIFGDMMKIILEIFWGYIYPNNSENIWGYDGIMLHIYIMDCTGKAKHKGPIRNQLRYAGLENGGQPAEWGTFSFSDKPVYTRLSETHCPVLTQIRFISNFLYWSVP